MTVMKVNTTYFESFDLVMIFCCSNNYSLLLFIVITTFITTVITTLIFLLTTGKWLLLSCGKIDVKRFRLATMATVLL